MSRKIQRKNSKISKKSDSVLMAQAYSGPLPVPQHFEQYEKILPGSADRILAMAEKEQQYRIDKGTRNSETENENIKNYNETQMLFIKEEYSIKKFAIKVSCFFIVPLFIIVGAVLAFFGHDVLAGIIVGTTLVSIVGIIIIGKYNTSKNSSDTES